MNQTDCYLHAQKFCHQTLLPSYWGCLAKGLGTRLEYVLPEEGPDCIVFCYGLGFL